MSGRGNLRREWLEAVERVEQRKQKEAARKERRRRRVLAQIGYTPEQFEADVREFVRKFQGDESSLAPVLTVLHPAVQTEAHLPHNTPR